MLQLRYLWSQLRRYIAKVEDFIDSTAAQFPLSAEQREQLLKSPELELDLDVSYEEFIETTQAFPEVLRRSAFLIAYILLEARLDEICDSLQWKLANPISASHLRGGGIERTAEYIRLLQGINIKDNRYWQDLCRLRELRNLIVHYNGKLAVSQLDRPIGRYIQSHPLLDLQPGDFESPPSVMVLSIRPGFCETVVDLVESFFDSLPRELFQGGGKRRA